MCRFASSVITRTSVLWLKDSDSHTDIIEHCKLPDDKPVPDFVKVEIVPTGDNWLNMDEWEFSVDQDVLPAWFNPVQDEHRARMGLEKRFPRWKGNIAIGGYLDLSGLTSLPANAKLSAGGALDLSGLTSLPDNAKLSAGGDLYLRSLTGDIPRGVVVKGRPIR